MLLLVTLISSPLICALTLIFESLIALVIFFEFSPSSVSFSFSVAFKFPPLAGSLFVSVIATGGMLRLMSFEITISFSASILLSLELRSVINFSFSFSSTSAASPLKSYLAAISFFAVSRAFLTSIISTSALISKLCSVAIFILSNLFK